MVQGVVGTPAKLEDKVFMNPEVSEKANIEAIEPRSVDGPAFLIADLNCGGCWRNKRGTVKPVQTGMNLLAITIIRI